MSKKLFFSASREKELLLEHNDYITFDSTPIKQCEVDMIINTSKIYIWKSGQYMIHYNVNDNFSNPISTILYLNDNIIIDSLVQNIVIISITNSDICEPYYQLTGNDDINTTAVIQLKTRNKKNNIGISNASITILEL